MTEVGLATQFEAACRAAIAEARRLGYAPTVWERMIDQHGAVEAAIGLVAGGDIQTGLERLLSLGREDLTVEHAVGAPTWGELFRYPQIQQAAQWGLDQAKRSRAGRGS